MAACLACGAENPPPGEDCPKVAHLGLGHFFGIDAEGTCPECGRAMPACAREPCSAMRGDG